jgi:carboxymethylenebutenolidase
MCVPADAELPALEGAEHRHDGERVRLTSADGTEFAAHVAKARDAVEAAVVVLPDIRGLFGFYEALAESFAAVGMDSIAIDYFARTSDIDERGPDWDYWPHVEQTTPEQVRDDVAAAVAKLRENPDVKRVFTVGFCFGGGHSFAQAAAGHGLAGVVGFYGPPRRKRDNFAAPIELVPKFECPVLGLFGGADQGIPLDDVTAFDEALTRHHVGHDLHVYPDAPHSFFDRAYADFADECADAWRRTRQFIAIA